MLVALVLRDAGAEVTIVGRGEARLTLARTLQFETLQHDRTGGAARAFDVVVDATGQPEGLSAAMALVRPRGTIVLKSTFHGETPIALSPLVVDEVTLIGSRCGPFAAAIGLLAGGRIDARALIDAEFPLDRFPEAFASASSGRKVLLRPQPPR